MAVHADLLLGQIRRLIPPAEMGEVADDVLLARFIDSGDEEAFARLVARHGPMVLRLCRRVLGSIPDAEDAFQATFLVLARQAARIRPADRLGGYLHTVAWRIACKARAPLQRRRALPLTSAAAALDRQPDPLADLSARDMLGVLDAELQRLPDVERVALVLCCLEGLTQEEAARRLGWTPDSVRGRLQRGRARLAARLVRRGLSLPAVLLVVTAADGTSATAMPAALAGNTVRAALAFATGGRGSATPAVLLARHGMQGLTLTQLKWGLAALFLAVLVVGGVASAVNHCLLAKQPETQTRIPAPPADETSAAHLDLLGDPLPEGALARIGTTRMRADGYVTAIVYSDDGRLMAFGTETGNVQVCDAATGKPEFELPRIAATYPVSELAFSPDAQTLAVSGFWCKEVHLVDVRTHKVRSSISNTTAGQENWSRCWQGPTLAFTPNGKTLLVGGKDGALHCFDAATAAELAALVETDQRVLSLTLTADGKTALTVHDDGALHLWDVTKRTHLRKLPARAPLPHFAALAPDGRMVALATSNTELELWEVERGRRQQLRTTARLVGMGFTPDGFLQAAEGNGTITVWDVASGAKRTTLTCSGIAVQKKDGPSAWFAARGQRMAWEEVGTIRPWDLATGTETPRLTGLRRGVAWAGFSEDGRAIHACGMRGVLGTWDAATGRPRGTSHKLDVDWGVRCLPTADRRSVVMTCDEPVLKPRPGGGRIFLWDVAKDAGPTPLREQVGPAWYAALTPDKRFLAATEAAGEVRVYDTASGKPIRSFRGREHEYLPTFSPDGKLLATSGSSAIIRLYDFATGKVVHELKAGVGRLVFAPDGRTLASGHSDFKPPGPEVGTLGRFIVLWDVASGRELRRIGTGPGLFDALAFSPDGLLLASGGDDGRIQVWEVASGQKRRSYEGHRHLITSLDFAPDGLRLVSASADGSALVWQVFSAPPADRNAADLDALWADLAGDGARAQRALAALLTAKGTVAFLGARLKPVVQPAEEQVKQCITDLASTEFATREAAQAALLRVGDVVEADLRRAREVATDPETRRRLTTILKGIPAFENRPERLRELRAVEVLGHLDRTQARGILEELARGAPQATLTRQARASLALQTSTSGGRSSR